MAAGVVLDGATSSMGPQGSPDGGTNWVTIRTAITNTGADDVGRREQLFSLGSTSSNVRFGVVDNVVAGAAAAFDITAYGASDSMDWY